MVSFIKKLSSRTWATVGLITTIGTLALAGTISHNKNVTQDLLDNQHAVSVKLPLKNIEAQFIGLPDVYTYLAYAGKGMYSKHTSWHYAETKDWTIINPTKLGGDACTKMFIEFNEYTDLWDVGHEKMTEVATKHKNLPIALQVHTPLFKKAPAAMSDCEKHGLKFDEASGMLTSRGKPIALLAHVWINESFPKITTKVTK